jgi:hypothetical protein
MSDGDGDNKKLFVIGGLAAVLVFGLCVCGVGAAIGVPAFTRYMERSRAAAESQQEEASSDDSATSRDDEDEDQMDDSE